MAFTLRSLRCLFWRVVAPVLVCWFGVGAALSQESRPPMRAVCLDCDAPKDLAKRAADASLNTLIVRFEKFGGADDAESLSLMREWGRTAAELKMAYYPAIRAFGPLSALGIGEMRWRRCKTIFGATLPMVCPLDKDYWQRAVAARVGAVCGLRGDVPVRGVLLSLYRNATMERHSLDSCFCDDCLGRFYADEAENGGKNHNHGQKKALSLEEKMSRLRQRLNLGAYHRRQSAALAGAVSETVAAIGGGQEDFSIGLLDCGDTWMDRGVIKGLCRGERPVPVGLDCAERASVADIAGVLKARWEQDGLHTTPIIYLDTTYFLPEDVAHEVAVLAGRSTPFCLTHTRGWWHPQEGDLRVYPALGSAEDYFSAVGKGASPSGPRKLFCERRQHPLMPRVALVHGEKWSLSAAKVAADMMENADIYPDLFPAFGTKGLETALGYYDVLILAPGYEKADPRLFGSLLPRFEAYMRCGGSLVALAADAAEKLDWLNRVSPNYALQVASDLRSDPGVPNAAEPATCGPIPLKDVPGGSTFFAGFRPPYCSLVNREKGGSYLLRRDVGRGTLLISPNKSIPFELVANLWFWTRSRSGSLVVRLMWGMERLRVGENRLLVGVGDQRMPNCPLSVEAYVISPDGRRLASATTECPAPPEGVEVPLDFAAISAGVHHVVVTVFDPASKWVIGRRLIRLDVPPPLAMYLDRDYYTTEDHAEVVVRCNPVDCSPDSIQLALEGSTPVSCERVRSDRDTATFNVPLAGASAGPHRLTATAGDRRAERVLVKREARKGEAKILRGRAICHADKEFVPVGMVGLDSSGADLIQAGVRLALSAPNGPEIQPTPVFDTAQGDMSDPASIVAWQLRDAPDHGNLDGEDVVKLFEELKKADPYRPALIGLLSDFSKDAFGEYLDGCDVLVVNACPLPFYRIDMVGESVRAASASARGLRPVWLAAQCFDWRALMGVPKKDPLAAPSPAELRNMVFQAFANGANGVVFCGYPCVASRPELRSALKDLLKEIQELSPVLMSPDSRQRVVLRPPSSPVVCRLYERERKVYLLACNPTNRAQSVRWQLPPTLGSAAVWGKDPEATGSLLEAELGPMDHKVYVFAP